MANERCYLALEGWTALAFSIRLLESSRDVLVQLDQMADEIGSLVIPEIGQSVPREGIVLARGGQARGIVSAGDRVGLPWAVGHELRIGSIECRHVSVDDLLYTRNPD